MDAPNTFIITPPEKSYSMVSEEFFETVKNKGYVQKTNIPVALGWLLNVKKFCVTERLNGACTSGTYEALYDFDDYDNYATPVTNISDSYKEIKIGEEDLTINVDGLVMQTSPRNPHKYTLQKNSDYSNNAPLELTGKYLGAFFYHKGGWYASFDDAYENDDKLVNIAEVTENKKRIEKSEGKVLSIKTVHVLDKFSSSESDTEIEECVCGGCSLKWVTPAGSPLTLPINYMSASGYADPWAYFWTKTIGTSSPIQTNGFEQVDANYSVNGSSASGQTVLRAIFAYVAPEPVTVSVNLSASADPPWNSPPPPFEKKENITLLARLYSKEGGSNGVLETYINSNGRSAEKSITLPATVCPQVLWLGVAIQPTGDAPLETPPTLLPSTTANITFSTSF